jgi:hypothetical protein
MVEVVICTDSESVPDAPGVVTALCLPLILPAPRGNRTRGRVAAVANSAARAPR